MASGESYARQLRDLSVSLDRLNKQVKDIKKKQLAAKTFLSLWMERNNLEVYQGFKLSKIKPKPKIPRKPAKEKERDALRLFNEVGIPDPTDFWTRLQATQKLRLEEEN